jgi:hypothetical protein
MADPSQASDDALYFSNASSGPDLFDASEDPDSKGGTPQFKHRRTLRPIRLTTATSLEPGIVTNLTPGAKYIP